jgi:CheY-like chemotaxis protein
MEVRKMYDIIAVDDSEITRRLFDGIFNIAGLNAFICGSAKEALEAIDDKGCIILFTDINMPVMSGIELARKVRKKNPDIIIIAQTANATDSYLTSLEFDDVIAKPFNVAEITERLNKRLEKYQNTSKKISSNKKEPATV